jgi:hypothetical protein
MNQTSVIFFGLLIGFIVFIVLKGELSAYLAVLGLSGVTSKTVAPLNPAISNLSPSGGNFLQTVLLGPLNGLNT